MSENRATALDRRPEPLHVLLLKIPPERTPTRTPDPGRFSDQRTDILEMDDVSDSGVVSLPTSDDEHHDFNLDGAKSDEECSKHIRLYGAYQEARCDRDVKSRLLSMCQAAGTVSERICLQQALALLRHYEARIEGLESTIAAMCHEATMARSMAHCKNESFSEAQSKSTGKIVATVLPFSEAGTSYGKCDVLENRKDLTESGVFEDNLFSSRGTQTEGKKWQTADLTAELEKLTRIRERIETGGKPLQTPKDLTYYEKRIEALQSRLAVYESSDDEQTKALRAVLQRSTFLTAQVTHLQEKISRLEKENIRLEEERSELEELENDSRLRCQRLEAKLSSLGEKKRSLKNQLEDLRREMTDRDSDNQDEQIEALIDLYEKKNQELEEREMEVRYRLQMLENTMPALMMWNIWRMMLSMQGGANFPGYPSASGIPVGSGVPMMPPLTTSVSETKDGEEGVDNFAFDAGVKEEDLVIKLKQLENKLNTQNKILADSKATEDTLRGKLHQIENWMVGGNAPPLMTKEFDADVEMFDKLGRMAKDRMEMDKRIRDFELKEKVFKETLEQADNLIAQLETQFKSQISEKDVELSEATARLKDSETKLKTAEKNNRTSIAMQERIVHLETQVEGLKKSLANREREKERLEKEESKLVKELEESAEELESMKHSLTEQTRSLEGARKRSKQLEEELRAIEISKDAIERKHMAESAVDELRYALRLEKAEKEEMIKTFEAKMEIKEKELEETKTLLSGRRDENVKSIFEELEEGCENDVDHKIPWGNFPKENGYLSKRPLPEVPPRLFNGSCFGVDHAGLYKETKIKRPTVSPPPPPVQKIETSTSSPFELKNMTAAQFRAFIALIEEGEPQVDVMSTKGIPISPYAPPNNLPLDCKEAHAAVKEITGDEAKHTVDALSKAYNHSTICGDCNERLGSFLEDVVLKLGVRMPRIKTVALLQV